MRKRTAFDFRSTEDDHRAIARGSAETPVLTKSSTAEGA